MNLRGLISVSGKPGLFKLVGKNKSGFILETLDDHKTKVIVNMATSKVASLEDITIFAESDELRLIDIFERMKDVQSIPESKTADSSALATFFKEVAPNYDKERVYVSDIKKIINWFNLIKDLPLFTEATPEPLQENSLEAEVTKKVDNTASHIEKQKPTKIVAKNNNRLPQKSGS